ncbi:hypothetical protein [Salinivibrio sp. YCSC6]|uniref:hypothetical protein n=1 Tax=Salinivibrio sp. YCSC6 TaxID=2003370 RepID=UPI000BBBA88C|nr:hypothetical protein [Salinivibrio sp. YCSC6]PCE67150.1 hypothetical protein B6G00_01885 [Salinivibrio sp. YCSC6]QCF35953.1 hypothetical protein E8E00_07095 [Salinivibrio sp. YCSC6]
MSLMNTNEAVKSLFGVEGSQLLRLKANSYVRNQVIPPTPEWVRKEEFSDASINKRGKTYLTSQGQDCLFNALVLDAFFSDTKFVKKVFDDSSARTESATLCEEILLNAQSVQSTAHLTQAAQQFIGEMQNGGFKLREQRLTSPFPDQRLPNADMAMHNSGLLYQLLRDQRLSLSLKEQILFHWFEQDLTKAAQLAEQVDSALMDRDHGLAALVSRVNQEYQEALRFTSLLNSLPE